MPGLLSSRLKSLSERLQKGESVPAISIRQPWASAILLLGKDVENRSNWPFKHRGPIVIHAARAKFSKEDLASAVSIARQDDADEGIIQEMRPDEDHYDPIYFPQGAIVALANLADVFPSGVAMPEDHPAAGSPWADDDAAYWLYLTEIAPVKPTPYSGRVGLFKIPYQTVMNLEPLGD